MRQKKIKNRKRRGGERKREGANEGNERKLEKK